MTVAFAKTAVAHLQRNAEHVVQWAARKQQEAEAEARRAEAQVKAAKVAVAAAAERRGTRVWRRSSIESARTVMGRRTPSQQVPSGGACKRV